MSTLTANYIDCLQASTEWFQCRLGSVTSSRVADVIAKRKRVKAGEKAEEMACRVNMRWELVGELITGKPTEHYVSRWMKEGKEREPEARTEYEIAHTVFVQQVGYVYHPSIKMAGASPDGLVGQDGLIEIKCPRLDTHLQYLADDKIPEDYLPQMLWQLACTERQWIDFVSYHPDCPEPYRLFIKRMERTNEWKALMGAMDLEVEQFLVEVGETLEKLKTRGN